MKIFWLSYFGGMLVWLPTWIMLNRTHKWLTQKEWNELKGDDKPAVLFVLFIMTVLYPIIAGATFMYIAGKYILENFIPKS